jgi:DNA transformation protein and related proteins
MPVTDVVVQKFIERLAASRSITHRKMFGGVGLYCDGVFFAVIDDDRLYFKVDDVNFPDYQAFGMPQWVIEGANGGAMPYYEVPDQVLADAEKLGEWIDAAVDVANRKKGSGKKRKEARK